MDFHHIMKVALKLIPVALDVRSAIKERIGIRCPSATALNFRHECTQFVAYASSR